MKMYDVKDEEERSVFLTDEQTKQTLGDFYRSVARSAGHEEREDTLYDCRRILVSLNVQDAIIQAYQEIRPSATRADIIMLLALCGPKADEELERNEVKIQSGFIGSKE